MATYYWVGGAGTWNATSTTNWASSSGGAGGAGVPTSADDVVFDSASNATAYSVTVGADAVCQDITVAGPSVGNVTFSLATTSRLNCFGSFTLPATGAVWTGTGAAAINFLATSTGKTITTNGVSLSSVNITFNGIGGGWTFGSAATSNNVTHTAGSVDTANYNWTVSSGFTSSGANTRSLSFGSSTYTNTSSNPFSYTGSNLTLNAGTSTIISSAANPTLAGGGLTFYNVSFTSTSSGTIALTGANIFNDLTVVTPVALKTITFSANQTINGTLTLGATNGVVTRVAAKSNLTSQLRTLTCNAVATLADVDFADIQFAGACISGGALTGTRLGNCGGNDVATITFAAGVNKYWYTAAGTGGNWSQAAWETSPSGTTPLLNNYPLAQDTIIFQDFGLNAGATTNITGFNFGTLDMSARTLTTTLASGTSAPTFHGDITLSSAVTITGIAFVAFRGQSTQNITSAGVTFTQQLYFENGIGSTRLVDNLTSTGPTNFLVSGTLDLNNNTYTCTGFNSSNTNTRSIAFGTGQINITNNNVTVWNTLNLTNFSYTGTPNINFTYSGGVGSRTIAPGTTGAVESNALSFNITAGTDLIGMSATSRVKNLNFTGFSGGISTSFNVLYYGDLTFSATMTSPSMGSTWAAVGSVVQNITTAGTTIDLPFGFDNAAGTFVFQDALTQGSTRNFTITNGTVQLKNGVTSTVGNFQTSGTNQKFLQSTTPGSQATLSQASGTVNVSYLSIRDINATGGATWFAPVSQFNVDVSNNDGWDFFVQLGQYMYTRRKNKRLLIS